MRSEFEPWLLRRLDVRTVQSRLSNLRRIERAYGDLDDGFARDRLASVSNSLTYSTEHERFDRPNPSQIPTNGDLRTGLATLKAAVALYRIFRDDSSNADAPDTKAVPVTPAPLMAKALHPRFDGRAALELLLSDSRYGSVTQAVASLAIFSHRATVRQTGNRPLFPMIRDVGRKGSIVMVGQGRFMADDNKAPTDAFLWANGLRSRGQDMQFNHIFPGTTKDPDCFTALPNICMTPSFLAKLTDTYQEVRELLQFRSFDLYGWLPRGAQEPAKPKDYDDLAWAAPLPPVPDVRATMLAIMRQRPKDRTVIAARELGWRFEEQQAATHDDEHSAAFTSDVAASVR